MAENPQALGLGPIVNDVRKQIGLAAWRYSIEETAGGSIITSGTV